MALCRGRSHTDPAPLRSREVVAELRSGHLGSGRGVVLRSHPWVVRDVVAHSAPPVDLRSSRVVVGCGDDSHRDVGCTRVVGRDGRSSPHHQVADRTHGRGSLESETGIARVDAGCRFGADNSSAGASHAREHCMDLHQRCSEPWRP